MAHNGACICRYIDQGRNPQLYTKECLERALARNEQVKGKIDTLTVRDGAKGSDITQPITVFEWGKPWRRFTVYMPTSMFLKLGLKQPCTCHRTAC